MGGFFSMERDSITSGVVNTNTRRNNGANAPRINKNNTNNTNIEKGINKNNPGAIAPRINNNIIDPESPKKNMNIGATAPRRNNSNSDPESPRTNKNRNTNSPNHIAINVANVNKSRNNASATAKASSIGNVKPGEVINPSEEEGQAPNYKMIPIKGGSRRNRRSTRKRKTNSRK